MGGGLQEIEVWPLAVSDVYKSNVRIPLLVPGSIDRQRSEWSDWVSGSRRSRSSSRTCQSSAWV